MVTNIYAYVAPSVIALLLLEMLYCKIKKKNYISFQDSIASYATAIMNQPMNLAVGMMVGITYGWIWNNTEHPVIEFGFWSQLTLYVAIDFLFYWFHRLGHRTNLFWAAHGLHHTGEEMNLAIALRTSITQRLFSFLFYWPLLFLGFSPEMIYTATGIHLFLGYWHHTRLINKLHPAFEYFFNSPSHHRVHHGINPKYIDKNYAEILIIWDRLFGTFEAEAEDPVYGSLSPPRTWNPIKLNLQHWNYMRRAIRATTSFKEKIMLPLMPPEWLPSTINPKFVQGNQKKHATANDFEKFESPMKAEMKTYLIFQVITAFIFTMLAISPKSGMTGIEIVLVSLNLWLMAIHWSKIMESKKDAFTSELARLSIFSILIMSQFSHYQLQFLLMNLISFIFIFSSHFNLNARIRSKLAPLNRLR